MHTTTSHNRPPPDQHPRVLIAGHGRVGSELYRQLHDAAHLSVLRRSASENPDILQCDLLTITEDGERHLREQLGHIDYAFCILAPGQGAADTYRATYVQSQQHFLRLLPPGVRRYFFISSTSVYGQDDGSIVDEDSPVEPATDNARTLRVAEDLAWHSGLPATVVRFSGIYGPEPTFMLRQTQQWLADGAHPAAITHWTNRIHYTDAAGFLAHLMWRDWQGLPVERLYIGTDDAPAPRDTVMHFLATQLLGAQLPSPVHDATRPASGKRLHNTRLHTAGYTLRMPTFRAGYGAPHDSSNL